MPLLISYSGALGGAERMLVEFASAVDGVIACPEGPLAAAAPRLGIPVFPLCERPLRARGGPRDRLRALVALVRHGLEARRLIESLEPELVVASGMRSLLGLTLAGITRRVPVVFLHQDFLPGGPTGALVRAAALSAARVVVASAAIAADLDPRGRLGDRLAVVHLAVDPDWFGELPLRPPEPPEVLVAGALVDWKRPDVALEAVARARVQRPELRLRVVGAPLDGSGEALAERLRARAAEPDLEGAVELAGAVPDLRAALARASCLLHCAPREPFGLVLVESLAAGRPVVAPDAGGPREIVAPACGVLYPPGDAAAAARAVLEVLADRDRAVAMGEAGRLRVREHFDVRRARTRFAEETLPLGRSRRSRPAHAHGRLAIVTVTHNSERELERMLGSVARHLSGAHVVVVDSGSDDRSAEVARERRDGITVELIELERNEGFGVSSNRGVAASEAHVTALLNPDVELIDDSLLALAEEALRPGASERLLAPLVLYPDGSRQDTVHPLPASAGDLARSLLPLVLAAGPLVPLAPWRSRRPRRVGWAVGCALVARTETLLRLGPFDERIFLYGEDLDLGLRAAAEGIETSFWPHARVLHSRAHATSRAFGGEPFERLARARREVVTERLGARRAKLDQVSQFTTFASRRLLKRALGRQAERERRQLQALRSSSRVP